MFIEESLYFAEWNYLYIVIQSYGKSLEYPPNCSRLTQQDLIIRELEEKRRSWADS